MSTDDITDETSLLDYQPVGAVPIKRVRPRHNAIMDFIIANPTLQMQQVAAHFQVTRSWLSIIINSDCFVAMMRDKQEQIFNETIIPLQEKMTGVAHRAIEKLGEKIDDSQDAAFILDASDKLFKNLGYGARQSAGPTISIGGNAQVAVVDSTVLAAARERMHNRVKEAQPVLPPPGGDVIDTHSLPHVSADESSLNDALIDNSPIAPNGADDSDTHHSVGDEGDDSLIARNETSESGAGGLTPTTPSGGSK